MTNKIFVISLLIILIACSKKNQDHHVTNDGKNINQMIGDENLKVQIVGQDSLNEGLNNKTILAPGMDKFKSILESMPATTPASSLNVTADSEDSLIVGLPFGLIGEQYIFGGVITKVSDPNSEDLGNLKLSDLPPIHVRTLVSKKPDGSYLLTLAGCFTNCDEETSPVPLINMDIKGIDENKGTVLVDLSALGKELDLVSMLDPTGAVTKLRAVSSSTVAFDYSYSTLVFDVKTIMRSVSTTTPAVNTEFTVRWYLKLSSVFSPAFKTRTPSPGVGFFTTKRAKDKKITRFSTSGFGSEIKYYIKNVPLEHQPSFKRALENWNKQMKNIVGRELLSWEFVNADHPRAAHYVPGDIRYNIIEWDLDNKAGYGGLGPSIANQYTGETISANILVQGPAIIETYKKWFEASQVSTDLLARGLSQEAQEVMRDFNLSIMKEKKARYSLKLGSLLELDIHSQRQDLEDPKMKGHFEIIPEGVTFETYMDGYFAEMISHEMGHNLGLRHNFRGNLGSDDTGLPGSVSRSIMEYIGRPYRHLSAIGAYDVMAISYGYKGVPPQNLNWFCTDEDEASLIATFALKSPECTKNDSTSDPFSYFEKRIARAVNMVINVNSPLMPVWKLSEVVTELDEATIGILSYATSTDSTAETWTNFFDKPGRPKSKSEVKPYVLERILAQLCRPEITETFLMKDSEESRLTAKRNFDLLTATISDLTSALGLYTLKDLTCTLK